MRLFLFFLVLATFASTFAVRQSRSTRRSHVGRVLLRMADLRQNSIEPSAMHRLWENFKRRYKRDYETLEEEVKRVKIYFENMWYVEGHNEEQSKGMHNYTLRLNEYSDMEPEEFVATMNGFKKAYGDSLAKGHGSTFLKPHHLNAPDSIDWRDHGYVTPVKNQGRCGSCWSFSATGSLEGQHFRKNGKLVSLSEQNLVDCSTVYGNNGCEGGLMDQAFKYIKDNDGVDTEVTYPYQGQDLRCRFKRQDVGADDTGFVDVTSGSEADLKAAIASAGPVSVAIDAGHKSFQFYSRGVYVEPQCSSTSLDHGVLAVGYGTSDDGQDYWIVKNSWGPTWGAEGYVMMARNQENQCGIATRASYPLV